MNVHFWLMTTMMQLIAVSLCMSHSLKSVQFESEWPTKQTVFLFDMTSPHTVQLSSVPSDGAELFNVFMDEYNLVYLTFLNEAARLQCTRQYLLQISLTNSNGSTHLSELGVQLNHAVKTCLPNLTGASLSIEYIFKVSANDSTDTYGLLRDDMSTHGIVAIVKIANLNVTNAELVFQQQQTHQTKFFAIKKFLPNFYMIRLTNESVDFNLDWVEVGLRVVNAAGDLNLASAKLRLKLVQATHLQLEFPAAQFIQPSLFEVNLAVKQYQDAHVSYGVYLWQALASLNAKVFNSESERSSYCNDFIRYSLLSANVFGETDSPELFELDSLNGHLSMKANRLDINQIKLNLSVYDTRKLFKTAYLSVNIQVDSQQIELPNHLHEDSQPTIIQRTLIQTDNTVIRVDLKDEVSRFSQLSVCYLNGLIQPEQYYLSLNNKLFVAYKRNAHYMNEYERIECKLIDSNVWLRLHVYFESRLKSTCSSQLNFNVSRLTSSKQDYFIANVACAQPNQLLYAFKNKERFLESNLFRIDPFNGNLYLRANNYSGLIHRIDLASLEITVGGFAMTVQLRFVDHEQSNDSNLSVQVELATIEAQLSYKHFYFKPDQLLDDKSIGVYVKLLDINVNYSRLQVQVTRVVQLDLSNFLNDKVAAAKTFQVRNSSLIYKPVGEGLFHLTLEFCVLTSGTSVWLKKQCQQMNFTIQIEFDLTPSQFQFSNTEFRVELRSNGFIVNRNEDFIDLKRLVRAYELFDFERLNIRFKLISIQDSMAVLNELNGLVYLNDSTLNDFGVQAYDSIGKLLDTALIRIVRKPVVFKTFNRSILIQESRPIENLLDLNELNSAGFNVECLTVNRITCGKLVEIDLFSLKLNTRFLLEQLSFLFDANSKEFRFSLHSANKKIVLNLNLFVNIATHFPRLETVEPMEHHMVYFHKLKFERSTLFGNCMVFRFETNQTSAMAASNQQVPFQIKNNQLLYMPDQDLDAYDLTGQKRFKFEVIANLNESLGDNFWQHRLVTFDITLIDDEPIIGLSNKNLVAKFVVHANYPSNQFIGKIDIVACCLRSGEANILRNNENLLSFEAQDAGKFNYLRVDNSTGFLFTTRALDRQQPYSLDVKISGRVGSKPLLLLVNVLVTIETKQIEHPADSIRSDQPMKQLDFYVFDDHIQPSNNLFKLKSTLGITKESTRFKQINQLNNCDVNWLNGDIYCDQQEVFNKKQLTLYVSIFSNVSGGFMILDYVQVSRKDF